MSKPIIEKPLTQARAARVRAADSINAHHDFSLERKCSRCKRWNPRSDYANDVLTYAGAICAECRKTR